MRRRSFVKASVVLAMTHSLQAAVRKERWSQAIEILERVTAEGQIRSASMFVAQQGESFARGFGQASSSDAMFLLGSISKPIAVMAFLALYDQKKFSLDDRLQKFIPAFSGDGRERVTIRHLLTHVSGLPDQLADNDRLRKSHAPLSRFVEHAIRNPLEFSPGSRYQYSSMGILLATHVAELISGVDILTLVDRSVLMPLGMKHSAQGLGRFKLDQVVPVQTEHAAPEAGGGDPAAREWDWNSRYWRELGAPWGGTHASAPDVGRFLSELLLERETVLKVSTARLMTTNQNVAGITPRGLGLGVGMSAGSDGCSDRVFGHTGSTGTIAWADPATQTVCVVLTSLPARAVNPHPRDLAAKAIAHEVRGS
jgi:CubicO group peptidase (beta-lactamase class C family)